MSHQHPPRQHPAHAPSSPPDAHHPRVASPEDAEALVDFALATLDALEPLIAEETRLFKAGKIRAGLALALTKAQSVQRYTLALEGLKRNAVAIGRFRPERLDELRARHEAFGEAMALNTLVIATARTVSESLLRELADGLGRNASVTTYGNAAIRRKPGTVPLAVSRAC
jgi:hypothetical protein